MEYFLKQANIEDIEIAMNMIDDGKKYLRQQGIDQWQTGYPDIEIVKEDIMCNRGYFVTDGVNELAYMCVDFEGEPAYKNIKGQWKSNEDYAVIHRLVASKQKVGKGLSDIIIQLVEKLCKQKGINSIKVDTDNKNKIMQHVLQKNGFVYCGTVWFVDSDKIAFEKILT
ncbi:GNAT family N-acetyltransferase [Clostridium sp. MD294]|uniref:GNAT family N-acetyltransferase n=1 Tax=Clostridium sp. MD294 TaxID=97138 RepID=UPI0002CA6BC4|nr:GNAT family N-acetyltransferase [Clostridium sp. MD294]NDO47704.1 GNAT family N-acetyltransferase [Clostridium sp. MD294]USF29979.1 hypothetical protein C820_001402 [Clostridium sp. MD294]